jgi:hypothetical protein
MAGNLNLSGHGFREEVRDIFCEIFVGKNVRLKKSIVGVISFVDDLLVGLESVGKHKQIFNKTH